jgi:predicted nucleic acid-binding protein
MKKVLLDSNIILDIAIERRDFYEKSKAVITRIVNLHFTGYVTASSVTDIYYVLKKSKGHQKSIEFLQGLFMFIDIAGVSKEVMILSPDDFITRYT